MSVVTGQITSPLICLREGLDSREDRQGEITLQQILCGWLVADVAFRQ